MTITYNEEVLNNLVQTNWWVCSFTPEHQLIDINLLEVFLKVKFTDPSLREPFFDKYEECLTTPDNTDNWPYITFKIFPPYDDSNINEYQFELDY